MTFNSLISNRLPTFKPQRYLFDHTFHIWFSYLSLRSSHNRYQCQASTRVVVSCWAFLWIYDAIANVKYLCPFKRVDDIVEAPTNKRDDFSVDICLKSLSTQWCHETSSLTNWKSFSLIQAWFGCACYYADKTTRLIDLWAFMSLVMELYTQSVYTNLYFLTVFENSSY